MKSVFRVATRQYSLSQETFVRIWSTALWALAVAYLLATFS